jgi:REP element-mobilizing transposase RayT
MAQDLFNHLLATGDPEQKTIIFCARDRHADDVASAMNNLYARWCATDGQPRREPYAFKCTASVGGAQYLADLHGASRSHYIATTVDLLTTGVDVPCVRNIVFFKYVRSRIAFYQMIGRGTRLDVATGKLMFRVYDYTNATRLFGQQFIIKFTPPKRGPAEEIHLNDAGRMVERWWAELPRKFPKVEVDEHVVMPNHFHGIIVIADSAPPVGADLGVRPNRAAGAHIGAPLPQIMQWFKTMRTNAYIIGVKQRGWPRFSEKLWQRGYYEHVVRNDDEFNQIRQYILMNLAQWVRDTQNPTSKSRSAPEAPWQI